MKTDPNKPQNLSGVKHVFRVQDSEGRGPFRPGFTKQWIEDTGVDVGTHPPIYWELGIDPRRLGELIPEGMHAGVGCVSEQQLRSWFSRTELRRLFKFGFSVVKFVPDEIIAETPTQVLFAHRTPLSALNNGAAE